ncbi:hypothetical protein [Coraliomargarita akajimensis]|uniref:Uncharacterized protein n=1 Tax=Coraliomargarita akajimensis (strain DSM 45221 / IAM 15411 / JCM 23193 / KCTC 12865 / 04OKA010-24) TaxID=583355 RepID=D5ENV1_CORAD|nr:hypothetical protein [Coraliomargarita akajimensis]ADE53610.1 hypothetical protein Caka_0585 [Coraliomargarita akajimensis DSM 45221]
MNEFYESAKPILGFLAFALTAFTLFAGWKTMRNIKTIDRKSTEELKTIISDRKKQFTFGAAIEELKKRNEDYSEVLPHLLDMSTSKNKAERLIGWGVLDTNFPEITKEIEFDPMKPSKRALQLLASLKNTEANQSLLDNA